MGEMLSKKHLDIKKIHQEYLLKKLASIKPEPNMLKIVQYFPKNYSLFFLIPLS